MQRQPWEGRAAQTGEEWGDFTEMLPDVEGDTNTSKQQLAQVNGRTCKKTLFAVPLSALGPDLQEMATVLQPSRTEHSLITLKVEPFDSNVSLSFMSSYIICKAGGECAAASAHRWVCSLCIFNNKNFKNKFPAQAQKHQN